MTENKKTILVTGSSRGIGKAISEILTETDEYILLTPTRQEMDISEGKSIDCYMQEHPEVDILINNAGINLLKAIDQIDDDSLEQMLSVNLKAPLQLIKHVSKHMKAQNYGRIINIASIWAIRSKEYRTLYSMTKFGLNGVTRALARELGPNNILINSVCPGYINTEMTQQNISLDEQKQIFETIPLRRFAEPREVAELVKFLISERNTYITGQTLIIDGGFLA